MKTQNKVLSDQFINTQSFLKDMILCMAFSFFIGLSAQFAFPLPFSPVPVTGQTFAILLTGMVLGWRRSLATLILYIFEGIAGLPVFTPGLSIGFARLLGPTGGYLMGFVFAATILGFLAERGWDKSYLKSLFGMFLALVIIYSFGVVRLAGFLPLNKVLFAGLYPFVPGEIFKVMLAAGIAPSIWKFIRR